VSNESKNFSSREPVSPDSASFRAIDVLGSFSALGSSAKGAGVRSAKAQWSVADRHAHDAVLGWSIAKSLAEQTNIGEIQEALGKTTNTLKTSWVLPCRALPGQPGSAATRQFADDFHLLLAVRGTIRPEDLVEPDWRLFQDIRSLP
jgi:hypothetical protein